MLFFHLKSPTKSTTSSLHSSEKKLTFSLRFYRCQKNSIALSNNECYPHSSVTMNVTMCSSMNNESLLKPEMALECEEAKCFVEAGVPRPKTDTFSRNDCLFCLAAEGGKANKPFFSGTCVVF